jgi:lactoylglutathione lyase
MSIPATAPTIDVTGHIGLNVRDLSRTAEFYLDVFGLDEQARSEEEGKRFAFLGSDGRLILTLWEQSDQAFSPSAAGLHHLSFQVDTRDEVERVEAKVRERGARLHHDGVVSHGEGATSGGIFFEDPDGIRLEVYAPSIGEQAEAPTGAAPTCGFF